MQVYGRLNKLGNSVPNSAQGHFKIYSQKIQ